MKKYIVRVCVVIAILSIVGVLWDMNRRAPVKEPEAQVVAEVMVTRPKVASIGNLSPRRFSAAPADPIADERRVKEDELDREYPMQDSPEALRSWVMTQVRGGAIKAVGMQDQDGSAVGMVFERKQGQDLDSLLASLRFSLDDAVNSLQFSVELYDGDGEVVFSGPALFSLAKKRDGWQLPPSATQVEKFALADVVNVHADQQLAGGK